MFTNSHNCITPRGVARCFICLCCILFLLALCGPDLKETYIFSIFTLKDLELVLGTMTGCVGLGSSIFAWRCDQATTKDDIAHQISNGQTFFVDLRSTAGTNVT